ncbi:hypothetical protein HDU77_007011 [Chytriomyces hyalinus]|nr:hypothetical protein HDU77_007011 [Chytriomyces hyalinus]
MSQDLAAALGRAPTCFTGCLNGNGQETQSRVDAGTLAAVCNAQAASIGAVPSNVNAVSAFSNCVANACTTSALEAIPAWQSANRPLLVSYCLASASPLASGRASGTGTVSAAGTATTTRAFVSTLTTLAPAIPDGGSTSDPLVLIVAGVGGGLAGLAILIIGVYCFWHRKRELARLKALAKRLSPTSQTQSQARGPHAPTPSHNQELFLVSHNNKSAGDGGSDAPRSVATDGGKNENGWLNGSNTRVVADTVATVDDDQAKYGVSPVGASGSSSKPTQGMSSAGIFGVDSERRFERKDPATTEHAKEKDNMHSSHTYAEVQDSVPNIPPSGISRDHGPASRTPPSSDTSNTAAEVTQDLPPPPYTMF